MIKMAYRQKLCKPLLHSDKLTLTFSDRRLSQARLLKLAGNTVETCGTVSSHVVVVCSTEHTTQIAGYYRRIFTKIMTQLFNSLPGAYQIFHQTFVFARYVSRI